MSAEATIFAVSSGVGRAGVAVIRISGPAAGSALTRMGAADLEPRAATLRALRDPDSGDLLDRALCLWFPAPASFTGEDVAELHVHGGRAVVDAVLQALARFEGLAPAEPGAFTRRAFDNEKLDLTAVEGLADLINAETEAQRRQALRQADGALAALYEAWRARLVVVMAEIEAGIDFSDEGDVETRLRGNDRAELAALAGEIGAHLSESERGERVREGLCVVIAGAPNTGKSSLLNLLARREAAIVSDVPGTTRDPIEVHLDLGGYPVTLIDTAGLREAGDAIEQEGVARANARIEKADLVLWLRDAGDNADPGGGEAEGPAAPAQITVFNKLDLVQGARRRAVIDGCGDLALAISAKTGEGIDELLARLEARAGDLMAGGDAAVPTRVRHRHALAEALGHVRRAFDEDTKGGELIAEDLRLASRALARITGRVDVEDLLDVIFQDFCIGK